MRPILLNSCARASTAAEARFRIDAPIAPSRGVRVFALDPQAEAVAARVQRRPWATARFFAASRPGRLRPLAEVAGNGNGQADETSLGAVLDGVDAAVMVATGPDGAELASAVGAACRERSIMTAGLALGCAGVGTDPEYETQARAAVRILRPYTRVILVTEDEADVSEILTALRA